MIKYDCSRNRALVDSAIKSSTYQITNCIYIPTIQNTSVNRVETDKFNLNTVEINLNMVLRSGEMWNWFTYGKLAAGRAVVDRKKMLQTNRRRTLTENLGSKFKKKNRNLQKWCTRWKQMKMEQKENWKEKPSESLLFSLSYFWDHKTNSELISFSKIDRVS